MFTMKKGVINLFVLVLISTLCFGCGSGGSGSKNKDSQLKMKILLPAYCYPAVGNFWSQLNTESAKHPGLIHVVVNMDSGPSATLNPDYVTAINNLRSNGGKCYGYVDSNYGERDIGVVKADIDQWYNLYDIDGIFVDRQANNLDKISYYQELYAYIKDKAGVDSSRKFVIANSGIDTVEAYISQRTADVIGIFESGSAYYDSIWEPKTWYLNYNRSNFWIVVYDVVASDWQAKLMFLASINSSSAELNFLSTPVPLLGFHGRVC